MGQLVIKYRSKNPGTGDINIRVDLSTEQKREIEDHIVKEIILDGAIFIPKELKIGETKAGREGEK